MEDDCVSGFFSILASRLCSEQNSKVCVKDNQPDYNQIHNIGNVPFLDNMGVWKGSFPEAEDSGMKEVHWLHGQGDEQIRKHRQQTRRPD